MAFYSPSLSTYPFFALAAWWRVNMLMVLVIPDCGNISEPNNYQKGRECSYVFEWLGFCCGVTFPALFLPETLINTLALSAGLMAYFRHSVALSNLIYPFASRLYHPEISATFYSQNFLIFCRLKLQVVDIKKRTGIAHKTINFYMSLIILILIILGANSRIVDIYHRLSPWFVVRLFLST